MRDDPLAEPEAEFEDLFGEAHAQLLARDRAMLKMASQYLELLGQNPQGSGSHSLSRVAQIELESTVEQLQAELVEQTAWAQRSAEQVLERDAIIRELQLQLEQQTVWALRSADEVTQRDALILQLTEKHQQDVLERDALISQLQESVAEQTAWAQRSAAELAKREGLIAQLKRLRQPADSAEA